MYNSESNEGFSLPGRMRKHIQVYFVPVRVNRYCIEECYLTSTNRLFFFFFFVSFEQFFRCETLSVISTVIKVRELRFLRLRYTPPVSHAWSTAYFLPTHILFCLLFETKAYTMRGRSNSSLNDSFRAQKLFTLLFFFRTLSREMY